MHLSLCTCLLAATFSRLVLAAPAQAATSTKSCNPTLTYTAKFDKLPTASAPPANFGSLDYNGFTVQNAVDYANLNAHSGANVAAAYAEGAYLTEGSVPGGLVYELKSFWFACATTIYGLGTYPAGCDLEVISTGPSHIIPIQRYGPFSYSGQSTAPDNLANMTKVELEAGAGTFYFNLVSGSSATELFLDDVVVLQQNPKCEG